MTYLVTDACIKCKYQDCVKVCPVNCFYEGANMLVISPDECIDCAVCVPVCPPKAIVSDEEEGMEDKWYDLNAEYSEVWPNIRIKGDPLPDADEWADVPNKLEHLDPSPGRS